MTMTLGDPIQADPDVAKLTRANLRRLAKAFHKVLQRAAKKKQIRQTDVSAYATFPVGCVQGFDILAKALKRKDLDAFIEVAVSSIR